MKKTECPHRDCTRHNRFGSRYCARCGRRLPETRRQRWLARVFGDPFSFVFGLIGVLLGG